MAKKLFAVTSERGPNWDDAKPMEEQADWRVHADYMNALVAEGFILLGGPLTGTRDVLLIARAESEAEIAQRFADDIWVKKGLLRQRQITPWWVRLSAFDAT
jgi:uncharacterized protein YciI